MHAAFGFVQLACWLLAAALAYYFSRRLHRSFVAADYQLLKRFNATLGAPKSGEIVKSDEEADERDEREENDEDGDDDDDDDNDDETSQQQATPIALSVASYQVQLASGAFLLEDVNAQFLPGRMTCIMGPSGAGKSSLLNVLAGRTVGEKHTGELRVNGALDTISSRFRRLTGFVPQDDVMLFDLTVHETLMVSARTRLPAHLAAIERQRIVERTLHALKLSHVRHTRCADLSGGERKRVSIAIELVARPSILLCDEPSSGLDARAALRLLRQLRRLSRRASLNVICIVHQPRYEAFELFDDVLLMARGGRTVYSGARDGVAGYFEQLRYVPRAHVNPADFYLDVIDADATLADAWRQQRASAINDDAALGSAAAAPTTTTTTTTTNGNAASSRALLEPTKVRSLGTWTDFTLWLLACTVLPWLAWRVFYVPAGNGASARRDAVPLLGRYGALYGVSLALFVVGFALAITKARASVTIEVCAWLLMAMAATFAAFASYYLRATRRAAAPVGRRQATFLGFFLLGFISGPFVFVVACLATLSQKMRTALLCGFVAAIVFVLGAVSLFDVTDIITRRASLAPATIWLYGLLLVSLMAYSVRYHRTPHYERRTANVATLVVVFATRAAQQLLRNAWGIAFDLGLNVLAGLFLGVIFYDRRYQPSILAPYVAGFHNSLECPKELMQIFPPICMIAEIPLDDPIFPEASLSCLALGMASVASSMRIFGDEKANFVRESRAGMSTEAFLIGKQLAHALVTLLAPLVFLFSFASLAPLRGSLDTLYVVYFLVYSTCAGIAYFVSIVSPRSLSQLVGVLFLLLTLTFSGANPTLQQLKNNELLGSVLGFLSNFSFLRWTQEAFYLNEIQMYEGGDTSMALLYGYYAHDFTLCIVASIVLLCFFRVLAYIALVFKENQ